MWYQEFTVTLAIQGGDQSMDEIGDRISQLVSDDFDPVWVDFTAEYETGKDNTKQAPERKR